MSEPTLRRNLCETLFAGYTPSRVGIGCKGSEKFADVQEKSRLVRFFCLEDAAEPLQDGGKASYRTL